MLLLLLLPFSAGQQCASGQVPYLPCDDGQLPAHGGCALVVCDLDLACKWFAHPDDTMCTPATPYDTQCEVPTCKTGFCGTRMKAAGTPCSITPRNQCQYSMCTNNGTCELFNYEYGLPCDFRPRSQCQYSICDGQGACQIRNYEANLPCNDNDPTNDQCGSETCNGNGACVSTPVAATIACDDNNTMTFDACDMTDRCDGRGKCSQGGPFCSVAVTALTVSVTASRALRFDWPSLFHCPYDTVITREPSFQTSTVIRSAGSTTCSRPDTANDNQFSLDETELPGKKIDFSLVGAISVKQTTTLRTSFYVPFETMVSVLITATGSNTPVGNRRVTIAIVNKHPMFRSARWTDDSSVIGDSYSVVTNSLGQINVRLVIDTIGATGDLSTLTSVTLSFTPAAGDGSVQFNYKDCAAPCTRNTTFMHSIVRVASTKVLFEDTSVINVRGKFAFLGFPSCGATDMKLMVFDANDQTKLAEATSDSMSGDVAFALPRGRSFKLQFHRASLPDYHYVNSAGVARSNRELIVMNALTDVVLDLSDAQLATSLSGSVYALQSMQFDLFLGLCEIPMMQATPMLSLTSSSCSIEVPYSSAVSRAFVGGSIVAPALKFAVRSLRTGVSSYDAYFGSATFATQLLDLRLPSFERNSTSMSSSPSSSPSSSSSSSSSTLALTERLVAPLTSALVLYMPLANNVDDFASSHFATSPTVGSDAFTFVGTSSLDLNSTSGLSLVPGRAGITFGRVTALDVSPSSTLSFWLNVSAPLTSTATLVSWKNGDGVLDVEVVVVPVTNSTYSVELRTLQPGSTTLFTKHVGSTAMERNVLNHIAIVIDAYSSGSVAIFVNGNSVAQSLINVVDFFQRIYAHECSSFFKHRCVREMTIGASSSFGKSQLHATIIDVALWRRALVDVDVHFVRAAGRVGRRLGAAIGDIVGAPSFVYRSAAVLDLPRSLRRTTTDNNTPSLSDQVLGETIGSNACSLKDASPIEIHYVNQSTLVSIVVTLVEKYGQLTCPLISGSYEIRSTFSTFCKNGCTGAFPSGSFGYVNYRAIVGAPRLLPASGDGKSPSFVDVNSLETETLHQVIDSLSFKFKGPLNSVENTLYFHVSGVLTAPNANVLQMPLNDIPLLRLHRPPGDQSFSYLSRTWASSVRIGVERSNSFFIASDTQALATFGSGVDGQLCLGVGASKCTALSVYYSTGVDISYGLSYNNQKTFSVNDLFTSEVMSQFQTTINDRATGKDGDIVVTSGITLLIADGYSVEYGSCRLKQNYVPTWKPLPNHTPDTIHVTLRRDIPDIIAEADRQMRLVCDGKLFNVFGAFGGDSTVTGAYIRNNCIIRTGEENIDSERVSKVFGQWYDAASTALHWTRILRNWDATLCAAFAAAGVNDYYASDTVPMCNQTDARGIKINSPPVYELLKGSANSSTSSAATNAFAAASNYVSNRGVTQNDCVLLSTIFKLGNNDPSADVERDAYRAQCELNATSSTYPMLGQSNGLSKLTFSGGTSASFATTSVATREDNYRIENTVSGEFAAGYSNSFHFNFIAMADLSLRVGASIGGGETSSIDAGRGRSDSTSVGFTLSDDDIGDQFAVSIFTDPSYGTPIFVTTGGSSSCPAEAGTNYRQALTVLQQGIVTLTSDDANAPIKLPSFAAKIASLRVQDTNNNWVYNLKVYNEDDLIVKYADQTLTQGSNFPKGLSSQYSNFAPIFVTRGTKFRYENVTITLEPACDDGVLLSSVSGSAVFNLAWTSACAAVAINTTTSPLFPSDRSFFVVNALSPSTSIIYVRNPDPNTPWSLVDGIFSVKLQYRAVGEQTQWKDVPLAGAATFPTLNFCKNTPAGDVASCFNGCSSQRGLDAVCSAALPCCNEGVSLTCNARGRCVHALSTNSVAITFDSSFGGAEGLYQLRAVTTCGTSNDGSAKQATSSEVLGRVDRIAPRTFGDIQEPADRIWWPGDALAIRFTELLTCDRPFTFNASIVRNDGSRIVVGRDLDVLCINEKIEVAFSRALITAQPSILGTNVTLEIAGVQDQALNLLASTASWAFSVGQFDAARATVSLADIRVSTNLTSNAAIIAALFGVNAPFSQFAIAGSTTTTRRRSTQRSIDVTILPGNALSYARAVLMSTSPDVDASQARVALATNEQQQSLSTTSTMISLSTTNSTVTTENTSRRDTAPVAKSPSSGGLSTGAIVGIAVGVSVFVIVALALIGVAILRKRQTSSHADNGSHELASPLPVKAEILSSPPPEVVKRTFVSEKSGRSKRVVRSEFSRRVREETFAAASAQGLPPPPPPWVGPATTLPPPPPST